MLKTTKNKMMLRIMMMAILMTGFFLFGASQMKAQENCRNIVAEDQDAMKYMADCWVARARFGVLDMREARFYGVDLRGLELRDRDLSMADFKLSNLSKVDLSGANLSGADFHEAILTGAIVSRSRTKGVDFDFWKRQGGIVDEQQVISTKAQDTCNPLPANSKEQMDCWVTMAKGGEKNLARAAFQYGTDTGEIISGPSLSGADLSNTNLSSATLISVNLSMANLSGANLKWANLKQANLSGANLGNANLSGAILSNADLIRTNFSGAILNNVDLSGSALDGADLSGTIFTGAILTAATVSRKTKGIDFDDWIKRGGKVRD